MKERKNLITIVLPLWDREQYTPIWIKENVFDDFNYIIADGSKTDANEAIFNSLVEKPNIKYIRYPFDANITDYVKKMLAAVSEVKTPYVMTCDNDDFLNYKGVIKCINALEENLDYGFANGYVRNITGLRSEPNNFKRYYRLCSEKLDTWNLKDKSGIEAIRKLFRPYKNAYYGVYRTNIYKNIWKEVLSAKLDDVFLIEYLQVQLAFCFSKLYAVNCTHYIRLKNAESSCAKKFSGDQYPSKDSIYFDEIYRAKVLKMGEIVANHLMVDKKEIYCEYHYFYSSRKRLRVQLLDAILEYLYKLNSFFSIPLSIKLIRKIA